MFTDYEIVCRVSGHGRHMHVVRGRTGQHCYDIIHGLLPLSFLLVLLILRNVHYRQPHDGVAQLTSLV